MHKSKSRQDADIKIPDRRISETILDFASILLDTMEPPVALTECRSVIQIAVTIWNAGALAMPIWGSPSHVANLTSTLEAAPMPLSTRAAIMALQRRRTTQFGNDPRAVGEWDVIPDGTGGFRFRCDARLPQEVIRRLSAE